MNGIYFTASLDGSRYISGTKEMQNATLDTGKIIEETFGRKLKEVISIVAIEQATQRTAQWANEIQQAAKHLGTTNEQLQTMQHIASATGTAESDVTGLFENIQKATQDAIDGNDELLASFKKLGITLADLQHMTSSEIFSKVMENMNNAGDLRTTADQVQRRSVHNITGTTENTLESINAGYNATPGAGLSGKGSTLAGEGAIASDASIQELSAVWSQFVTSMKEAGTMLLPVASILVAIAKTLVDAFNGVADTVKNLLTGNLKHAMAQIAGVVVNGGAAVAKTVIGLFGMIPGLGGAAKKWNKQIDEGQGVFNSGVGLGGIDKQREEAIGSTALTVATMGESGAARVGSAAYRGLSKGSGKIGMRGLSKWAGGKSEVLDEKVVAMNAKHADELQLQTRLKKLSSDPEMAKFFPEFKPFFEKTSKSSSNKLAWLQGKPFLGPSILSTLTGMNAVNSIASAVGGPNSTASQPSKAFGPAMQFQQLAGGSSNLKMGGLFGIGSVGEKIVDLNQKMLYKLGQIADQTNPNHPHGLKGQHMYNQHSRAGGI